MIGRPLFWGVSRYAGNIQGRCGVFTSGIHPSWQVGHLRMHAHLLLLSLVVDGRTVKVVSKYLFYQDGFFLNIDLINSTLRKFLLVIPFVLQR